MITFINLFKINIKIKNLNCKLNESINKTKFCNVLIPNSNSSIFLRIRKLIKFPKNTC